MMKSTRTIMNTMKIKISIRISNKMMMMNTERNNSMKMVIKYNNNNHLLNQRQNNQNQKLSNLIVKMNIKMMVLRRAR